MTDDRNEGECYGPFHAGFVCGNCARRIRELETELAEAKSSARVSNHTAAALLERRRSASRRYDLMRDRAEKAETEVTSLWLKIAGYRKERDTLEAELSEFREQSKVQHEIFLKERAEVERLKEKED